MPATAVLEKPILAGQDTSVVYAVEPLWRCREGIEALMERHGNEFTFYKSVKGAVDPDWSYWEGLELRGRFRIATARQDSRLVGYFLIMLGHAPHYRKVEHAFEDTFYLEPQFRAGWGLYRFVKFAVGLMEASGAAVLVVASKVNQDLAPIWKRLGFQAEEVRYTKVAREFGGR